VTDTLAMEESATAVQFASVVVAHGMSLFRAAICTGLEAHPSVGRVTEASSSAEVLEQVERYEPDVALIDIRVPKVGGVATCAALRASESDSRVVIMCDGGDNRVLLSALEAGADGFVTYHSTLAELSQAVDAVARGEAFVPPRMLGTLLKSLIVRTREEDGFARRVSRLSRREYEVFALLVAGKDQAVIAKELVISPATARTHMQNVLRKLEVHSRLEATALAIQFDLFGRSMAETTQ
jgi:two-component system NarL family response regulator